MSSFSEQVTVSCQKLQDFYVKYFGQNSPQFKTGGDTAFIKHLLSPQNTNGFEPLKSATVPGKKRATVLHVEQPVCFDVAQPAGITCTTERVDSQDETKEVVFDMDVDPFRPVNNDGDPIVLLITEEELNRHCTESDPEYIQRKLVKHIARYEEQLDKALCELAVTLVGQDKDGNALVRLPMFVNNSTTGTSVVNDDSLFWLEQKYKDILGQGQYALLGGMTLNKLMTKLKWAGLNQAGIDLSKVGDMTPYTYYSRNFDNVIGSDSFLQMAPGSMQLVTFNEFGGPRMKSVTNLYTNSTIISPATGLEFDYKMRYDYECNAWRFEVYLRAKLAANIAGGCGYLANTNGILLYQDCSNVGVPECPPEEG